VSTIRERCARDERVASADNPLGMTVLLRSRSVHVPPKSTSVRMRSLRRLCRCFHWLTYGGPTHSGTELWPANH
jgi:hypothetical protein